MALTLVSQHKGSNTPCLGNPAVDQVTWLASVLQVPFNALSLWFGNRKGTWPVKIVPKGSVQEQV